MIAEIANDALISVRILSKDIFDDYDDLFDYILRSNFCSNELLEGKNTSFWSLFDLNSDDTYSFDGFASESDIYFLSIVFKLGQKLVYICQVSKSNHEFKFG